jgi:hypothetical protein
MIDAMVSPAALNKTELLERTISLMRQSVELMNNALENDKSLVVGREAAKIYDFSKIVLYLLK